MKKLITIVTIMIMIMSVGILNAYAAYDCDLVLTPDKEKYEPGDTVEITVSAQNINAGDGITGISTVIEYNTTAFENMELVKTDNWDTPTTTGTTVSTNVSSLEGQTTNQDMFKIKLKVKSGVANGQYDVILKSIEFATDDYTTINKEDVTLHVNVEKATQNPDVDPVEETKPTLSINKGDNAYNIVAHDDVGLDRIEITMVETQKVVKVEADGKDLIYSFPLKENDDNFIKVVAINTQNVKSEEISVRWSTKKDENQGQGSQNQEEQKPSEKPSSQKDQTPAGNLKPTTTTKQDTTVSNKDINNAGLTVGISGLIIAAAAIGTFTYIKYRKYNGIK